MTSLMPELTDMTAGSGQPEMPNAFAQQQINNVCYLDIRLRGFTLLNTFNGSGRHLHAIIVPAIRPAPDISASGS
jgi:hypothetical protein